MATAGTTRHCQWWLMHGMVLVLELLGPESVGRHPHDAFSAAAAAILIPTTHTHMLLPCH